MHVQRHRYYKRFQMEIDLRRWVRSALEVRTAYRFRPWSPELLDDHAEVKYLSFRDEVDAVVFPSLGEFPTCLRLMQEIVERDGFVPEATWLAQHVDAGRPGAESCGTIQAIRTSRQRANIQNIGVTPRHRGRGVGAALINASLWGLQHVGVTRVGLEVTADNEPAVRLYRRLGFQSTKTLYKASEDLPQDANLLTH